MHENTSNAMIDYYDYVPEYDESDYSYTYTYTYTYSYYNKKLF
jgi:hypothetical protein